LSDGLPQEGRVINMPSSSLCDAEDKLNCIVNHNRLHKTFNEVELSDLEAEAIVNELAELRQKVVSNWDVVEDVCIGTQVECVKCENLKPCMCDKK